MGTDRPSGDAERMPLEKSTEGSAVEQVVDAIHKLIGERGLRVGDVLPSENDLAKKFGASRNTVREAMRTLRAYGVLETRQKVGAMLIDNRHEAAMRLYSLGLPISEESFTDIQEFRRLIEEGIAGRVFAAVTPADIETLEMHNRTMEGASDVAEAAINDYEFHRHIVGLAGNRTTEDVYLIMRPVIQRLMENGKRERLQRRDIAQEHQSIIDAIRERDETAYVYWVRMHLKSGMKFIGDGLERQAR